MKSVIRFITLLVSSVIMTGMVYAAGGVVKDPNMVVPDRYVY